MRQWQMQQGKKPDECDCVLIEISKKHIGRSRKKKEKKERKEKKGKKEGEDKDLKKGEMMVEE